jgi:hypothetical protein
MEIPLFPLPTVLMPHGHMALQIFEARYLDLVADCMKHDHGFGVIWLRRGGQVKRRAVNVADLGDYGTYARIVDWDQLANGLLGISVRGEQRFALRQIRQQDNGLVLGEVTLEPPPEPAPMQEAWHALETVLRGLEIHPHVQQMGLEIDYADAWQVANQLVQLLPMEDDEKYRLLGIHELSELIDELDHLLNHISGED